LPLLLEIEISIDFDTIESDEASQENKNYSPLVQLQLCGSFPFLSVAKSTSDTVQYGAKSTNRVEPSKINRSNVNVETCCLGSVAGFEPTPRDCEQYTRSSLTYTQT
jgi:hypothetical protein